MNDRHKRTVIVMVGLMMLTGLLLPLVGGETPGKQFPAAPPPPPDWNLVQRAVQVRFPGADHEAVMAFMQQYSPGELVNMKELTKTRSHKAVDGLTVMYLESQELMALRESDAKMFLARMRQRQLESEVSRLAAVSRTTGDAARKKHAQRLQGLLTSAFKAKQEAMQLEIVAIESELSELKQLIVLREEHQDAIVANRTAELLGMNAHLQW